MENGTSHTPTPEGSRASSADSSTNTSPNELSPKRAALLESEVSSLSKLLGEVSKEAARKATLQHWRKCIIGNEKDEAFFVSAILKHGNLRVYERALREYGDKFLEAANNDFLDRAVEARLQTIDARELVALLSKTKRLGYEEHDIVDSEEDVVPKQPSDDTEFEAEMIQNQTRGDRTAGPTNTSDPLLVMQYMNAAGAGFSTAPQQPHGPRKATLPTHPSPNVAADARRFVCPDCNASFSQSGGLTYVSYVAAEG